MRSSRFRGPVAAKDRYRKPERRAAPTRFVDSNVSTVACDNLFGDREPQTGAPRLTGHAEKLFEDLRAILGRNPLARIRHLKANRLINRRRTYFDRAAGR